EEIATGGWRPLNLERPPFSFPPPLATVDERCLHTGGAYRSKRFAAWALASLPRRAPSARGPAPRQHARSVASFGGHFYAAPNLLESSMTKSLLAGAALASLVATAAAAAAPASEATVNNPLLAPWTGAHGGVPPFDKVKVEQFKPALETAMAEQLAEIDKIAADPAPPNFENTLAALERSGRTLDRVTTIFGIYSGTMSTLDFQKVEEEMSPKLAAFFDQITQNERLFKRIAAVYEARERSG